MVHALLDSGKSRIGIDLVSRLQPVHEVSIPDAVFEARVQDALDESDYDALRGWLVAWRRNGAPVEETLSRVREALLSGNGLQLGQTSLLAPA